MKITDIIKVTRVGKDYRGQDCRESIDIWKPTREEAINQVAAIMVDSAYFAMPEYRISGDGTMWVFRYYHGSWSYDIVRKVNGRVSVSTCHLSESLDRQGALNRMLENKQAYDGDLS
jgi:hypothetical protein